jgi:hypothetical protein
MRVILQPGSLHMTRDFAAACAQRGVYDLPTFFGEEMPGGWCQIILAGIPGNLRCGKY